MSGYVVVLLALHAVWLALLLTGRLRWSGKDSRPRCTECPITQSLIRERGSASRELTVLAE